MVIDIVPNHLGISAPVENPAWWDVLRLGRSSAYANWFDIDWSRGRIVLPMLGDDPVFELVDGELRYFEHRFPLAPGSWTDGDDPAAVHDRQHYELVHHSRGNTELNYRRFFAVTTLAGVRVEDPEVFAGIHALVREWPAAGVTGLRIDHPDGLVDPAEYLERLRAIAPDQWITVEKILEAGEQLPADWPVSGTTGYDAMREVNGVFVDPDAESAFTELYQRLTGDQKSIAEHIEVGKRMVVTTLLPAEVRRMAALVPEVADAGPALAEVAVAFEVYRSYLPAGAEHLDHALAVAAARRPELAEALTRLSPRLHDHRDELARRMQQLSGATMAKGVEDTAYYRYSRFIALNEVGGDPGQFGVGLAEFHALQAAAAGRAARLDDRPVHPRHQAGRGRPRPAGRTRGDPGRVGGVRRAVPGSDGGAQPGLRLLPGPDAGGGGPDRGWTGCTRTRRRRCGRPVTAPPGPNRTPTSRRRCTPRSTWRTPTTSCAGPGTS